MEEAPRMIHLENISKEYVHEPATLRFFTGVLKPIGDWPEKLAAAYRADFGDEQ